MESKNITFIDHIIMATAYSKMTPETQKNSPVQITGIEMKIITLLDSILSALSSAYRDAKVKLSHKIMMDLASIKYGSVTESTSLFFQKQKELSSDSSKTLIDKEASVVDKEKTEASPLLMPDSKKEETLRLVERELQRTADLLEVVVHNDEEFVDAEEFVDSHDVTEKKS